MSDSESSEGANESKQISARIGSQGGASSSGLERGDSVAVGGTKSGQSDQGLPVGSEEERIKQNQAQLEEKAREFASRGEVSPEEKAIMEQFTEVDPKWWEREEIQGWLSEVLTCSGTHVSNLNPVLQVDVVFTKLGYQINEGKFLEWLVTFKGAIEYNAINQNMVCGIKFEVDKSGDYTGMVYVKLRSVGIKTLVEIYFNDATSLFPPNNKVRVRQPSRQLQYETRRPCTRGGARFETDVYKVH